jgi:predicted DNA-binding transcriptional regulator AlpA
MKMATATQSVSLRQPVLDPGDILTPQQLADRLQVSKSWVFEQTRNRSKVRNKRPLPCLRLGKYLRFSWAAVSEWLTQTNP